MIRDKARYGRHFDRFCGRRSVSLSFVHDGTRDRSDPKKGNDSRRHFSDGQGTKDSDQNSNLYLKE